MVGHRHAGEDFPLAYGIDASSGRPDWLGEIFLWLSNSLEFDIRDRDDVGRIPYRATIFNRQGLSPEKPYASMLMAWMESALRKAGPEEALPRASSPLPTVDHLVVPSHDIDFCYVNRRSALTRVVKNLAIAVHSYRSWSYFSDNLIMLSKVLFGSRVGDYVIPLTQRITGSGFSSTFFAVAGRRHRRDPDYELKEIASQLKAALGQDFSVGIHGSYRSVVEDDTLTQETQALATAAGLKPLGGRQHWLRFGCHKKLFDTVTDAGLIADSTLGFPDMPGFRNGAAFAFPPYDFARERPYDFLEIPLVLTDGALEAAVRRLRKEPEEIARGILAESRKWGWGGIALLWHNPLESLSVPAEVNRVFWSCVQQRAEFRERWLSLDEFLRLIVPKYQSVGLLPAASTRESVL